MSDMYILEHEVVTPGTGMNATCQLCQSADFSHMQLSFEFDNFHTGYICTVKLEGIFLAKAHGQQPGEAKNAACRIALNNFRNTNWTVQIRKRDKPTPDPNKLTSRIGHCRGEADRENFETGLRMYFTEVIDQLDDYTKPVPLSHELNKHERESVHAVAKAMGLKVETKRLDGRRGAAKENDPVFLIIGKKLLSHDLFEYIWNQGGETWKFRIKPPLNFKIPVEKLIKPKQEIGSS